MVAKNDIEAVTTTIIITSGDVMLEVLTRARRNDTVMRNMPSYEAQINKANLAEQEKPSFTKHKRYVSEENPGVAEILDHLKQKLAAMAKRLRRYRESHLRKHQNTEFATNQKNFYKNLKKTPSDGKENDAMPKKEELLQFWTGIWNTPTNHRITKWYQDEKREM
ncbi:hypothetical protein QE152_g9214, partial [Popillia japonica]